MTTKARITVRSARDGYSASNLIAAGLVLADIQRYGGEHAGLVQWARLVIEKAMPTVRGPLFAATGRQEAA